MRVLPLLVERGFSMNRLSQRAAISVALALCLAVVSLVAGDPAAFAASKPYVGSLSPNTGKTAGGTRVTINGSNFTRVSWVKFGTTYGKSIRVLSSRRLQVTAPPHAAGTVNVTIHSSYGTSAIRSADRFTYISPPAISAVSPTTGRTAGGTRVTITGSRFLHVTSVKFGSTSGTSISVVSATKLLVTAPAHSAGLVAIRVNTAYGTSPVVTADHYTYVAPPAVYYVDPAQGSTAGVTVSVYGANFSAVSAVTFDGTPGTNVSVTSTNALTVTAPAHAAGPVDVRVVTKYGTSSVSDSDRFTYLVTSWGPATLVDPSHGTPSNISCTSSTFCVAVDEHGAASIYNGTSWSPPQTIDDGVTLPGVSCATPTFCVAVGSGDVITYNGTTWSAPSAIDGPHQVGYNGLMTVSCPTTSFCMAGDSYGNVVTYNGSTWSSPTQASPTVAQIDSVSCVSATFCAVADQAGHAMTFNGTSWSAPTLYDSTPQDNLTTVSCASTTFCVVVDANGYASKYNGSTWLAATTLDAGNGLGGVSCSSATFCVATDGHPIIFNGTTWSVGTATIGWRISCAGSFCATVDGNGNGQMYDGTTWSTPTMMDSTNETTGLSCVADSLCVAIDSVGKASLFTNNAWSAPASIDDSGLVAVSCVTTSFCVAMDQTGRAVTYNGSGWSSPTSTPLTGADAVSCATTSFCVAVDDWGNSAVFNGSSWTAKSTPITNAFGLSISCPTATFCMSTNGQGSVTTFDGTSWSALTPVDVVPGQMNSMVLSCVTPTDCVASDENGAHAFETFNGTSWTPTDIASTVMLTVSCPTETFCAAFDGLGNAWEMDNGTWTLNEAGSVPSTSSYIADVSCSSTAFCMAIDPYGQAYVGRSQ